MAEPFENLSEEQVSLVTQFCQISGASPHEAEEFLTSSNWDLSNAVAGFFASQDDEEEGHLSDSEVDSTPHPEPVGHPQASNSNGPRTLGGDSVPSRPVPSSSSSAKTTSSSRAKGSTNKKFATLKDLSSESGPAQGRGHGPSQDDDDDDDENHDMFAGGEKSGLAVQNPGDQRNQVKDILEKAKKGVPPPGKGDSSTRTTGFRGAGQTLGGDDTPSQLIPDPHASVRPRPEPVTRKLHFWKDGFSVEDGELYRFDDPANARVLSLIKSGRAPLDIMNVEPDQQVDVSVEPHTTDYVPPKKKFVPFAGGGQRLGSPTPGAGSAEKASTSAAKPTSTAAQSSPSATVTIDESQPTVTMQIRLSDGTRLVSRFNTTHTIGDIYSFVASSRPNDAQRGWVLMTTFPSKELTDKSTVLGDMAEFKRGGVIVQKMP